MDTPYNREGYIGKKPVKAGLALEPLTVEVKFLISDSDYQRVDKVFTFALNCSSVKLNFLIATNESFHEQIHPKKQFPDVVLYSPIPIILL